MLAPDYLAARPYASVDRASLAQFRCIA